MRLLMLLAIAGVCNGQTIEEAYLAQGSLDKLLFEDYDANIWSTTCWGSIWDFSGVSWNGEKRITMINRDCFLTAKHWSPEVGATVVFKDRFGKTFDYTIIVKEDIWDDCAIGILDRPISTTLPSYALDVNLGVNDWVVGVRARPGFSSRTPTTQVVMPEVVSTIGHAVWFRTFLNPPVNWYTAGAGDSSSPLFTVDGGRLQLVSAYTTAASGVYYGRPAILTLIDDWLEARNKPRLAQEADPPEIKVTVQVSDELSNWTDTEHTFIFPEKPHEFFRLKIEPN